MSPYRRVNLAHCLAVSVHFNAYGHERCMTARNDIFGVGAGALMGDDRGCPRKSSVESASRSALVDIANAGRSHTRELSQGYHHTRLALIVLLFLSLALSKQSRSQ